MPVSARYIFAARPAPWSLPDCPRQSPNSPRGGFGPRRGTCKVSARLSGGALCKPAAAQKKPAKLGAGRGGEGYDRRCHLGRHRRICSLRRFGSRRKRNRNGHQLPIRVMLGAKQGHRCAWLLWFCLGHRSELSTRSALRDAGASSRPRPHEDAST